MIRVVLSGHNYHFPVSDVLRLFFGHAGQVSESEITSPYPQDVTILSSIAADGSVDTRDESGMRRVTPSRNHFLPPNREVKRQLYLLLSELTGKVYPWGSLTGIRPTLIARESNGMSDMVEIYSVRPDKAELAFKAAEAEDRILSRIPKDGKSIYIGIPFCPSRCSYCSFISESHSVNNDRLLVQYVDAIIGELHALRGVIHNISALYIGGGTPTVMGDELFSHFIRGCLSEIKHSSQIEITVEAGRPDTITANKLRTLRDAGVNRICINPQTLSDKTLATIGRNHTSEQFIAAYRLARAEGFSVINTDVIAGLPGESLTDFKQTLDTIVSLSPENITVHTLSRKRTSRMSIDDFITSDDAAAHSVGAMLQYASELLYKEGYLPYYLYRQKDTVGGHENTGYSIPGRECLYNVAMMSDARSVVAIGAGGMSKRAFADGHLLRCPCVRNPREYIARVEEMAEKKKEFFKEPLSTPNACF